jgi:hypothetical protein
MNEQPLQSILQRLANEAVPPNRVNLLPGIRSRLTTQTGSSMKGVPPETSTRRAIMTKSIGSLARLAALVAVSAALVALLGWTIRSLAPKASPQAALPTSSATIQGRATEILPTVTPTSKATRTPIPPSTSRALPGVSLRVEGNFPTSPAEASVYTQQIAKPLTVENAKAIAAQLGVRGNLYTAPSEGSGEVYVVSDGRRSITFVETASYLSYFDYDAMLDQNGAPPFEEQKTIAEMFLKEHGLADFPHALEALDNNLGTLRVVPLLEGRPVRQAAFESPNIDLRINRKGQVIELSYGWSGASSAGSFPILSAQEAWQKVLDGAEQGISTAWLLDQPRTLQTWLRSYPLGQRATFYGYFGRPLQPLEAGVDPLVTFANLSLRGEKLAAFLGAFQVTDFVQITGTVQEDDRGVRFIQLESWQRSPYPDDTLSGTLRRQGDTVRLESKGRAFILPDVPADVPDGLQVEVRGVIVDGNLDWSFIQSGETGEWGNQGIQTFVEPASGSPTPAPTPLPEGMRPGDQVEGLEVTVHVQPGGFGLLTLDERLWINVQAPTPDGLAALDNLPVRVWGTAGAPLNGQPAIRIDRYEEIYPGLRIQAWLGTWQQTQIEGQDVLLFTAQDSTLENVQPGTQYVLFSPALNTGSPNVHGGVGTPGMAVIYEGLLIQGEQFGGYPVIHTYSGAVAGKRQNLDGYTFAAPEPESPGPGAEIGLPKGEAVVDNIELVYFTVNTRGGPRSPDTPPIYIQPVWRFLGHYADGTRLEIMVQALKAVYSK